MDFEELDYIRTDKQSAFKYSFMKVVILRSESNENRLSIKKALFISDQKPSLNDKKLAIKLYLFS